MRSLRLFTGVFVFTALLVLACQPSSTPTALDDTPENRLAQIDRYFVAQPPEQMMKDMAENMSAGMPDDQRARFVELMTKLDMEKLKTAMRDSMVKHFTADEVRALADFYGSEVGKSAMGKYGAYMADVMPTIQAEVIAVVGRAQSEFAEQSQQQEPVPDAEAGKESPMELPPAAPTEPPNG
jgi:hypothetical protein